MKKRFLSLSTALTFFLVFSIFISTNSHGQIITTIVGNGTAGHSGDGGAASSAQLNGPDGLAVDTSGNLFISDWINNCVRKVTPSGIITTIAGNTTGGFSGDGGAATAAMLNGPGGLSVDSLGNLYIADMNNNRIRKVTPSGTISTIIGVGSAGYTGDGGAATSAQLNRPTDIKLDGSANMYVSDFRNNCIRKITPGGTIRTFAGTGSAGFSGDGGAATAAQLNHPVSIIADSLGSLFVADDYNNCIRKINSTGIITTYAGTTTAGYSGDGGAATAAKLFQPSDMRMDHNGNLLIVDYSNNRVRKVTPSGIITTITGTGTAGFSGDGGAPTAAQLYSPTAMAVDRGGNIYIADQGNNRIRKIVVCPAPIVGLISGPSTVYVGATVTLADTTAGGTWSSSVAGIATVSASGVVTGVSGGSVVISYSVANSCGTSVVTSLLTVASATTSCGIITTVVGTGVAGFTGDGGPATAARLYYTMGVTFVSGGTLYIADWQNSCVRKVSPSGVISTIAGNGFAGFTGDGGAATGSQLNKPYRVAVDAAGNVYIADWGNHRLRMINTSGIINTIAGTGTAGYSGDGGPATAAKINNPAGVILDGSGNIYIADEGNNRIRKINTSGNISTIAGTGTGTYGGDGGSAMSAQLYNPSDLTFDVYGNMFIADFNNNRIRKINTSGIISTVAGTGTAGLSGDGGQATAAQLHSPMGIAVDGGGNMYIADVSNERVRRVNASGIITTIAGSSYGYSGDGGPATAAQMYQPHGVSVDPGGYLYIADYANNCIRKVSIGLPMVGAISGPTAVAIGSTITLSDTSAGGAWSSSLTSVATVNSGGVVTGVASGSTTITYTLSNSCGSSVAIYTITVAPASAFSCNIITTVAGNGSIGFSGDGGSAVAAALHQAGDVAVDSAGNIFIADFPNNRIRKVSVSGIITTVAGNDTAGFGGDGGQATAAFLNIPTGVAVDRYGNLYIADQANDRIRKVNPAGIISTVAGTVTSGFSGDGGPATLAKLYQPWTVKVDNSGNLMILDLFNNRIRKVNASGIISTIAGNGSAGYSGDGGAATAAQVNYPKYIASDISGNVYIADINNFRLRKIDPSGNISTIAGTGTAGYSGDGGAASAAQVYCNGVVTDAAGNIYISDAGNGRIRKIDGAGIISTYAGTGSSGFSGDGFAATAAQINAPWGIAVDRAGYVYFADVTNSRIRKISPGTYPVGPLTGPVSVCPGASITLADTSRGGSWASSSVGVATVSSSGVVTGITSGTSTIVYMVTNACGTAAVTQIITVDSLPNAGTISGSTDICQGAPVTMSATGASSTGSWGCSNTLATITGAGLLTGSTAGIDTVKYLVTSTCGSDTAMLAVNIHALPDAGTIAGATDVCVGSAITLSNAVAGGSWSAANSRASVSSGVVHGMTGGIDTIIYTVTDAFCNNKSIKVINVNITPVVGPVGGPSIICSGIPTVFTDTSASGTWSNVTGRASVSGGMVTGISLGADTIVYTVANACGATSAKAPVMVNASVVPVVTIVNTNDTPCVYLAVTLTANIVNGGSSPTIIWQNNGVVSGSGTSYTFSPHFGDVINCALLSSETCPTADSVNDAMVMHMTVPVTPYVTIRTVHDTIAYPGQIIAFDAMETYGGSDPHYQWFLNGVAVPGATQNYYSIEVYHNETVYCQVISNMPCITNVMDTSNSITIHTEFLGVGLTKEKEVFSLVPNPSSGSFVVSGSLKSGSNGKVVYVIYDVTGQEIKRLTGESHNGLVSQQIALSNDLANGTYFIRIQTDGETEVFHFVVSR